MNSTNKVRNYQIGIEAANLLIDRLEHENMSETPITKVVACEIVERFST